MTALVSRFTTLALVALVAAACVSALVAETPEQRAYAAVGEYLIVAEAAAEYAESPAADATVVIQLAALDDKAQKIIAQIDRVVRGDFETDARERAITDLTRILDFFRAALVSTLVEAS